jgi:putative membrane protein
MLTSAFAITLAMEHLGSAHDVLFGAYDYSDLLGPKVLGTVPVIVPVAWFMMLYPARATADLIVGEVKGVHSWARIAVAALAMTAWDLSLDPRMVADGAWVWHDAGPLNYFGIPLSNFAGWLITSAAIYAVWSVLEPRELSTGNKAVTGYRLRISGLQPRCPIPNSQLAVWAYIFAWAGESLANALFWGGPLVAAFVFAAMGVFAAPALLILARQSLRSRCSPAGLLHRSPDAVASRR